MNFELVLTEEKVKPHQVTAMHLLSAFALMGTGALFYWMYLHLKYWEITLVSAGFLLMVLTIIKNRWVITPKVNLTLRIIEIVSFAALGIFVTTMGWWMPAIMFGILTLSLLFSLTWENSKKTQRIVVDAEGIKLPFTSRKRFIEWEEVETVILRYGTLTIDSVQQQLFQWNVQRTDFDSEIFEAFCNSQIEAHRHKRKQVEVEED